MSERNPIAELEQWKAAHKMRSCRIEIDNGYGACCWSVDLYGEGVTQPRRDVRVEEVDLMKGKRTDWPGLGPTILAALDQWNKA